MAARLLNLVLIRQLGVVHRQVILRCRHVSQEPIEFARRLHVKIYDKDAGFDVQREQIRQNLNEDQISAQTHEKHAVGEKLSNTEQAIVTRNRNNIEELKITKKEVKPIRTAKETDVSADSDVFGSSQSKEEELDDDDEEENTRRHKKLRTIEYARIIKDHLKANQLKDAIAVLEKRILKEDGAKPDSYIYNLLISGCAKAGYTRKAFSLFTKMRQRGLAVKGGVYTSLFNACSNAQSPAEGLERANRLREIMLERAYEPNVKNYNAMIKAYGRCGDVKTAYQIADEMIERKLPVNEETFNFLLQACASDKEYGFRHCLLTWHKMLQSGLKPDYYTFNLVLRCVRDCSFGDLPTMHQLLQQILKERQNMEISAGDNAQELQMPTEQTQSTINLLPEQNNQVPSVEVLSNSTMLEIPNLLAPSPHLGSMISLAEVVKPHDRFLLLGGLNGFLELMKQYNITPNIETFTTMLEVIPPTNAAEKQVLIYIRRIGLKVDIDFFNILIKKRSMRFDYEGAKEVLSMIRTAGLSPDIVTYGVLSLGCRTVEESRELLSQMHQQGIRMNIQILGAMLRQGCAQNAFPYITEIMQISLDENIKPNDVFLRHLHNFYLQCARAIDARHPKTKSKAYKNGHAKFCDKYRLYQEEHGIAGLKIDDSIKKIRERPYTQYKEESIEGIEPLKNENLARKQKLRKYIKKIKIDSLRDDGHDNRGAGDKQQPKFNPFTSAKQLN